MSGTPNMQRARNIVVGAAILWLALLGWQRWEMARLGTQLADAQAHGIFLSQRHRLETVGYKSTEGKVYRRLTHAEIAARLKSFLPHLGGFFFHYSAEWQEFLAALKPEDIPFALACMDQMPELRLPLSPFGSNARLDLHRELLELWMKSDPAAALGYAKEIPEAGIRKWILRDLLQGWIKTSVTDATAWVEKQPAGVLRDQELIQVLPHLSADASWNLLQNASMSDSRMQASFVGEVLDKLAKENPAAVAPDAAAGLAAGDARRAAVFAVAQDWGAQDPSAALTWAGALPMGRARDEAVQDVLVAWTKTDPPAAASAAVSLPAGRARDNSLDDVISNWVDTDSNAAGQWLQGMPAGDARDAAMGDFADAVVSQNPVQAATWAQAIGDENARNDAITNVAGQWLKSDPAAASAWLTQSGRKG
ncbi:MAG: hypothetical protein ABSH19_09940 [Opitutales bacterium]